MGEQANLGINYFDSAYDLAPGYKIAVKKAQAMKASEYLAKAGLSSSEIDMAEITESSAPDVLVVTLAVANEDATPIEGGVL